MTFQDANGNTFECPRFLTDTADYAYDEVIFDAPSNFATAYIEVLRYCPGNDAFVDELMLERQ